MAMFETLTRAAVVSSALLATVAAATVWVLGWEVDGLMIGLE